MTFEFADKKLPIPLLAARTLLWLQAIWVIMFGMVLLETGVFLGSGGSIAIGPAQASGAEATTAGLLVGLAGAGLVILGARVSRLTAMLRNAIVGTQVVLVLAALEVFNGGTVSLIIEFGLIAGVLVLLFLPESQAFVAARSGSATPPVGSAAAGAAADPVEESPDAAGRHDEAEAPASE